MTPPSQGHGNRPDGPKRAGCRTGLWSVSLGLLAASLLMVWLFPYGASAYHLELGGRSLDLATEDGSPSDAAALTKAMTHLEAALRWHEDNAQAQRLLSHAHLLQGNLLDAARAAVRHSAARSDNSLAFWELAQVYKTIDMQLDAASEVYLLEQLTRAHVRTPAPAIDTVHCNQEKPHPPCYAALTEWEMPLAAPGQPEGLDPLEEPIRMPVLVVHPSTQVEWTMRIPAHAHVLTFWIGTAPHADDMEREDRVFSVVVDGVRASDHPLSPDMAYQGWWPTQIDLGMWAGQEVSLVLETGAGLHGQAGDSLMGWGDPRLVSADAADLARLAPAERLAAAWRSAGFTAQHAIHPFDRAWQSARYHEARTWQKVIERANGPMPAPLRFRFAIAEIAVSGKLSTPVDPVVLTVHPLRDGLRIPAESLQWMLADPASGVDFGDRLGGHSLAQPASGATRQASAVLTVVDAESKVAYEVTVRARQSTSQQCLLQVGNNLAPMTQFSLTPAWQEFTTTVTLDPGLHIIDIQLAPDTGDALLDWIQFRKLPGPSTLDSDLP